MSIEVGYLCIIVYDLKGGKFKNVVVFEGMPKGLQTAVHMGNFNYIWYFLLEHVTSKNYELSFPTKFSH